MSRPPVRVASVLAALALSVSACGDAGENAATDEASDQGAATIGAQTDSDTDPGASGGADDPDAGSDEAAGTEPSDDPGVQPETDEPETDEPAAPAADVAISGSFADGEIQLEDRRFDVPVGSSVLITFESDEVDHIHLHGYDILADLVPGEPAEIAFVADSPGTFEVELEDSGRFLFELLVR